jgi:hypothetical protein
MDLVRKVAAGTAEDVAATRHSPIMAGARELAHGRYGPAGEECKSLGAVGNTGKFA